MTGSSYVRASEWKRREHRQAIDAQLLKAMEAADRKVAEIASVQLKMNGNAGEQQEESLRYLQKVKEAELQKKARGVHRQIPSYSQGRGLCDAQ